MTFLVRAATSLIAAIAFAVALCGCSAQVSSGGSSSADSSLIAKGAEPLVLIVVGFAGDEDGEGAVPYRDDFDWHALAFENDKGVSRFYTDQSLGTFTWVPAHETSAFGEQDNTCAADAPDDGIVHVVLPRGHGHWLADDQAGDSQGVVDIDAQAEKRAAVERDFEQCTVDALRAATRFIDFSSYDTDNSGTLDDNELGVGVIYAGYNANGDWMHLLDEAAYPRIEAQTFGPINVGINRGPDSIPDHGIIMGEMETRVPVDRMFDTLADEGAIAVAPCSLATLAHELGHYLGLPDYYDTSSAGVAPWSGWTPGCLSVMDVGAALNVSGEGAAHDVSMAGFDPFSREKLGWLQAQTVNASGTYEVRADGAAGGKNVLRVETRRKGEYFLIENRQTTGFDAALKGHYGQEQTGGIVVWHVDEGMYDTYLESNGVNLPLHHPALTVQYLMNADGKFGTGNGHTLDFADSATPDTTAAFWDNASAQQRFRELGVDALQLWTYGESNNADDPQAREYTEIYLAFPDESADIMRIELSLR